MEDHGASTEWEPSPLTGTDLRAMRLRTRLSQQELADAFGCHKSTVCRWERGQQQVRLEDAERLVAVLVAASEERAAQQTRLREQVHALRRQ